MILAMTLARTLRSSLMVVFGGGRGRLQRDLCEFAAAESDFAAIEKLRPGHKTAAKELQSVRSAEKAMAAARAAR
jgi:hypothetical protein